MEREGCNYPEAVRRLAKRANIEINEREKSAEEMARQPHGLHPRDGHRFRATRSRLHQLGQEQGINMELLKELHIVGTSKEGRDYSAFYNRITIPIRSRTKEDPDSYFTTKARSSRPTTSAY